MPSRITMCDVERLPNSMKNALRTIEHTKAMMHKASLIQFPNKVALYVCSVLVLFTIPQCFMVLQGELHLCWGVGCQSLCRSYENVEFGKLHWALFY